ncbi:PD40 domain-containing protein [Conexibacter arvalis]|uniref:WD40 repeat protein n=1 Tax=Conexibacter arvalis TaxID=912552 RepID=A0A840II33_9ACTN|nr:PD40 domain-containing protein [Conexibacter arvalis]MBB4664436.1 hypothetical protein [Conexibacter arvalis]
MHCSFRPRRRVTPALAAAAALVGVVAHAAPAVAVPPPAPCPNDAVREQQGSTRLPDCRAYEQVSPVDKNGGTIAAGLTARAQPGAVAFWSTGAFAGAASNMSANYRAIRGEDGWVTSPLNPPTPGRNPVLMDQPYLVALSGDFSRALIATRYPVGPDDQGTGAGANAGYGDVLRTTGDGRFEWLTQPPTLPDTANKDADFGAATDDLGVVAFNSFKHLTVPFPKPDDATQQVYVRAGDTTRLVSVAPDGTLGPDDQPLPAGSPLPGGATVGSGANTSTSGSTVGGGSRNELSDDGSTVWFTSYRTTSNPQLYVRVDALGPDAETRRVSRSRVTGAAAGDGCTATVTFLAATADGSRAWFACPTRLTDDAASDGGVYVYDRDGDELRFIASTAGAGLLPSPIVADDAVDHLWFSSRTKLTDDAVAGGVNVYVLTGDDVRHVATVRDATLQPQMLALSPDGTRLAFESRGALDPRAGSHPQVYSLDFGAPEDGVVCVSCRPDGSDSEALADLHNAGLSAFVPPNRVPPSGAIDDDGRVFFTSADKLLPEDENGTADVYQYRDGELTLISSGKDPGGAVFAGASADGTDVFLITGERLAPQDTDNGVADIYTARVGGGFLAPTQPPVCGEDCQGPPPPGFLAPEPESGRFTGPGDLDDPVPPRAPTFAVGAIGKRQRAAWARRGRTTLVVRASHAGRVRATVGGRIGRRTVRVAAASRQLARGGRVRLTLRLSKRARAHLARHRALRVTVTVRHSRVRGAKRTTVTLRKPAPKTTKGGQR